jgi:hypothetical protein
MVAKAPEDGGHSAGVETTTHQEALLTGTFLEAGRRLAEAPRPGLPGAIGFGSLQRGHRIGTFGARDTQLLEFVGHAARAIARRATIHERLDEALGAEVTGLFEGIEQGGEFVRAGGVRGQLAGEFDPPVLPAREQGKRPAPQGDRRARSFQAASAAPGARWLTP